MRPGELSQYRSIPEDFRSRRFVAADVGRGTARIPDAKSIPQIGSCRSRRLQIIVVDAHAGMRPSTSSVATVRHGAIKETTLVVKQSVGSELSACRFDSRNERLATVGNCTQFLHGKRQTTIGGPQNRNESPCKSPSIPRWVTNRDVWHNRCVNGRLGCRAR